MSRTVIDDDAADAVAGIGQPTSVADYLDPAADGSGVRVLETFGSTGL